MNILSIISIMEEECAVDFKKNIKKNKRLFNSYFLINQSATRSGMIHPI